MVSVQGESQQNAAPTRKSVEQLRDEIRENVRQQLEQAARETRVVQGVRPVQPVAPLPPITYTSIPPHAWDTAPVIPQQVVDISIAFFMMVAIIIIGLPLARAFSRRMDRKVGQAQIPAEIATQLDHLSQAVDAIAVEVERISEGQRFTTRLISEQRGSAPQTLPTGSAR
jgi:hypothetical protein